MLAEDSALSVISTRISQCKGCSVLKAYSFKQTVGIPFNCWHSRSCLRHCVDQNRTPWTTCGSQVNGFQNWSYGPMTHLRYLKLERQLYDVTKQRMEEPGVSGRLAPLMALWPWGLWVKLLQPWWSYCGPRMLKRSRQIESDRTGNQHQNSRGYDFYSFLDIFIGTLTVLTNDQSSVVLGFVCTSWFPKSHRQSAGP